MDLSKMERIKNWIKTEIEAEADVYPYKCKECPAKFKEIEKAKDHFETKHVSFTEFVSVLKPTMKAMVLKQSSEQQYS